MTTEPLKLVAAPVLEKLVASVDENLERYRSGDFLDLTKSNGWAIESQLALWDTDIPAKLDPSGTPEAEVRNSRVIYEGIVGMTPALARDERVWTRLSHVECLEYARNRWLPADDRLKRQVEIHMFAKGLTGCRDDNAIGRLWWNGHVASLACPQDIEVGLRRLLARANNRMQIIERSDTGSRQPLVAGIVRMLGREPWLNIDDRAIADFMIDVNKYSGGIVFEALGDDGVDSHLQACLARAMAKNPRPQAGAA